MSLDITILNKDGFPQGVLCVEMDLHFMLMQSVKANPNSILLRMEDYYADALFTADELDEVKAELDLLVIKHSADLKLIEFLNAFKDMVALAKARKTPLEVLAD